MTLPMTLFVTNIITSTLTFAIIKTIYTCKKNKILKQAKEKALNVEKEAELYFKNKQMEIKEKEISLKRQYESQILELKKIEITINESKKMLDIEKEQCKVEYKNNLILEQETKHIKCKYYEKLQELIDTLAKYTSLSIQEAKEILFSKLENSLKIEKANYIRRYEQEAKEEARIRANNILALATSRYAGEYGAEKLINTIHLPDDEMKGRIIGKDGRNIKTLEKITGVDIIIDDTPNLIIVSSFNLYRRAIAKNTIKLLIEDGRIQPSRVIQQIQCSSRSKNDTNDTGSGWLGVWEDVIKKMAFRLVPKIGQ